MTYDDVIVGSGLTGAVIARCLADAGRSVVVLERRGQMGGNVADTVHCSGIPFHLYGPHLFRTRSEEVWRFVHRFASFRPYRHQIKTRVDGRLENWPIAASCIRRLCGDGWAPECNGDEPVANFEEAALRQMPRLVYEKFVQGYTEKHWGVPARSLSADLWARAGVRLDDNPYLHPHHPYQGLPVDGYGRMVERMLDGIPVVLGCDYLKDRDVVKPRQWLVFTGPIDEYFGFELGRLAYRGQRREHTFHAGTDRMQPCAQVNEPGSPAHIRDIEWKHLMPPDSAARTGGTLLTRETPFTPEEPDQYEYPFPDERNEQLHRAYRAMAAQERGVLICGRLGEYRYYDMDHAIGRAMMLAGGLAGGSCTTGSTVLSEA